MSKIVEVKHDTNGNISEYKTDDGKVLNREKAVKMADSGKLEGVASFTTRDGSKSIRSNRGQEDYSLDNLPEMK